MLRVFRKGQAVRNRALLKNLASAACALITLCLATYKAWGALGHALPVSIEDAGLAGTFLVSLIGILSTLASSPLVGLPEKPDAQNSVDPGQDSVAP